MRRHLKMPAFMLALALTVCMIPSLAFAETTAPDTSFSNVQQLMPVGDDFEMAIVLISNDTYSAGPWSDMLAMSFVDLVPGMTIGDAIKAACDDEGISIIGATAAEGSYITDIDGLAAGADGPLSGWMYSVNDWFPVDGLTAPVQDLDIIWVQYTTDGGYDVGSIMNPVNEANDKRLWYLDGDLYLEEDFDPDVYQYTLIPDYWDAEDLDVGMEAGYYTSLYYAPFNYNYQVHVMSGGVEYTPWDLIPVTDGSVITVTVGDPSWPSMNNGPMGTGAELVPAAVYTLNVSIPDEEEPIVDDNDDTGTPIAEVVDAESDSSPETGDGSATAVLGSAMILALAGATLVLRRRTQ